MVVEKQRFLYGSDVAAPTIQSWCNDVALVICHIDFYTI